MGWYSVALGINTTARGSPSTALGIGTTASGYYSTALGVGTTAQSYAETVLGSYNTLASYPDDDQWVSTDRLFVIGNGDYEGTASNALVVLKNGRTGIGHSTPKARLNVRSDGQWRWDVGDGWGDFSIDNGTYGLAFGVATGGAGAGHSYIWAKGGAQGIYFGNPTDGILLNVGYGKTVSFGELEVRALGTAGATALCRNAVNEIATCSSSGRYKEAIVPLERGLEAALQLRPVTFDWKDGQGRDLGFVAEEVAAIDSLLVTHNEQGQIEGVKYGPLTAVLVKALQEQQAQIAALHKENAALAQRLRVQEFYAAQRSSERSDEMALIRAELQRLREQMSAQSSMQRTAALP